MNPQNIQLGCLLKDQQISQQQGRGGKAGNQGSPKGIFAQFLGQVLGGAEKGSLSNLDQVTKGMGSKHGWLELFRNALLSGGVSLKDASLSSKAIHGLRKLLLAEGFSEDDVKGFLKGLVGSDGKREIKIHELLEKTAELKERLKKEPSESLLDASVLPHLETLLRALGLDVQQARKAIGQAKVDGGKLSLKRLVQNLKTITDHGPEAIKPNVSKSSPEDIKEMLGRIDMAKEAAHTKGSMSLERFVQIIEKKVASLMPHGLSEEETEGQVKGLLQNVLVAAPEKGSKSTLERRYANKLKGTLFDRVRARDNENRVGRQIREGWNETSFRVSKTSAGNKGFGGSEGFAEFQGNKNLEDFQFNSKFAEFQASKEALYPKIEKLVEAVKKASSQKAVDRNVVTATQVAKEGMPDRVPVPEIAAKPSARPIPLHVVNQVGRQLGLALKRGANQMRLQLKPPHLGSIQLEMTMKDNVLKIAMVAEHQSVKELIVSHVNELRDALVEQGVELQKVDVEINHNPGQSMAHAQEDFNRKRLWKQSLADASDSSEGEMISAHELARQEASNSLLDMFA